MRSVGHGALDFVLPPDGSKPGDTAHLLTNPIASFHALWVIASFLQLGPQLFVITVEAVTRRSHSPPILMGGGLHSVTT